MIGQLPCRSGSPHGVTGCGEPSGYVNAAAGCVDEPVPSGAEHPANPRAVMMRICAGIRWFIGRLRFPEKYRARSECRLSAGTRLSSVAVTDPTEAAADAVTAALIASAVEPEAGSASPTGAAAVHA